MPSRQDAFIDPIFQSPGCEFKPAAYWFWHSIPARDLTGRQLEDFRDKGFGRIYIQARLAMPLDDYLSETFVAAYKDAVEAAKTLGLRVGIYDDYNWISGQAAGRTVRGRDELRERHLFWSETSERTGRVSGIVTSWTSGMERTSSIGSMTRDILPGAIGKSRRQSCIRQTTFHRSTKSCPFPGTVTIDASSDQHCAFRLSGDIPAGMKATVFLSARSRTSRLINYLLPEAAQAFITHGLEPLVSVLGELIPDPIDQIFYDQPAPGFYHWGQKTGNLENSLPFSAGLARSMVGQTGRPLETTLLSLVRDIGPSTAAIRAKAYGAFSRQMNEAFFGTLRAWAEDKGLSLSGPAKSCLMSEASASMAPSRV